MSIQKLQDIANILRRESIKSTSMAGSGHPSSCMSCAEIMSCLFFNNMQYDIENPVNENNDEFILSKGHAAPILYSALHLANAIHHHPFSLRKIKSPLEGHPIPSEHFRWHKVATGSLGQGLSAGLGMALASKLKKLKNKTYVLLGDSEMAEGSNYEALQLAAHYNLNNLTAIIDINKLGQTTPTLLGQNIKAYEKIINSFGWNTMIIDGHNINQIVKALKKANKSKKPTMILAKTIKGKGFREIENKQEWHGKPLSSELMYLALKEIPSPEMPNLKIKSPERSRKIKEKTILPEITPYEINEKISTREAYGNALANLAHENPHIIAIDAEVSNSTFSGRVKEIAKKQFIETYIAEQNMISTALGMSKKGLNVFASSFAAFLSRAHDQIRMAALSQPNLTICGSHAGVSIGQDGGSQMGLEDIAMFRALPGSIIFYPSDSISTEKLTYLAAKTKGLKYIRTTRAKTSTLYNEKEKFPVGDFKILKKTNKDKITLIGCGITLHESLKAHKSLKEKRINSAVIDLYCIKPLNINKLIRFIEAHGNKVIITEDHYKQGGIGEFLSSKLSNTDIEIKHLAITEQPHSGLPEELLKKYKINDIAIVHASKSMI